MQKKIVFLWPNAVPYMLRVYEQLGDWGYKVTVYNSEMDHAAPCFANPHRGVDYRESEHLDYEALLEEVKDLNPDLLVTSGWHTKKYKKICRFFKQKKGIPTLCKIDSQYLHTWHQKIGFLLSPWFCKPSFSHMLVPGVRQYYFARRLHYDRSHILLFGLSADTALFDSIDITTKQIKYPHTFLFVGRLLKLKGLELLLKAWKSLSYKKDWRLMIVGSGPEKERLHLDNEDGVELHEYMQQDELARLTLESGVMVLPSTYEAWAVVMHELAAAGLPLLCSETCGAVPHFLIRGFNGFTFETGNYNSLRIQMEKFIDMPDDELYVMAQNSRKLSCQINPEFSAASIVSVIQ